MKIWKSGLLAVALLFAVPAWADDLSNGSWSTTDNSNNATPPNGWPAGMNPAQVEPTARSNMGGTKRWWERANPNLSTTGSAGAYVLTPSNTSYPTAYTQGEVYCAKANFSAVGSDTLSVNSLGAKPFYVPSGTGLVVDPPNTLVSGQQFCASYDGALNSGGGGFQILTLPAPYLAAATYWNMTRSSNQTISTSATTIAAFDTKSSGSASYCSTSTHICTPTVAGTYSVNCALTATTGTSASAGTIAIESILIKNGTAVVGAAIAPQWVSNVNMNYITATTSSNVAMNGTTDTLACYGYSDAGATLISSSQETQFNGQYIAP